MATGATYSFRTPPFVRTQTFSSLPAADRAERGSSRLRRVARELLRL